MAKFRQNQEYLRHEHDRLSITKDELDAKHLAALEAKSIIFWKSPVRIFKARSRKYFVKVFMYALVLILAAIAFGEFFLVGVILSVIFVVYVLATAVPETIEHRITSMGIVSGGRAFLWEELDAFWFDKRGDDRVLIVSTNLRFPGQLIILLTNVSERAILDLLEKHLHYHHAAVKTVLDNWAAWLQSKINLE